MAKFYVLFDNGVQKRYNVAVGHRDIQEEWKMAENKIECDICGGSVVIQAGGKSGVCERCGTKYSIERIREILNLSGIENVKTREDVDRWKSMLAMYLSSFDFVAAENAVKKILEVSNADNTDVQNLYKYLQVWKYLDIKHGVLTKYTGKADTVVLPSGVKVIEREAFRGNKYLKEIALPNSLKKIDDETFSECESLASITIPKSVKYIGDGAFRGCTSLVSVQLPSSVTKIGDSAFRGCSSLKSIHIPDTVTEIGDYAFSGCSSLSNIQIPVGITQIGERTFSNCSSLVSIQIPLGITTLGDGSFSSCSGLASMDIPSSVAYIGDGAFRCCTSLSEVHMANSVTDIGQYAFCGCSSLTGIHISSGVSFIRAGAFASCLKLEEVYIPHSVRSIGNGAFAGTPFGRKQHDWITALRCQWCGGSFRSDGYCSQCGRKRDYSIEKKTAVIKK